MKAPYGEGLATHADPESCGVTRKGGFEALTGARAGQVFSRETTKLRGADAVRRSGRQNSTHRYREMLRDPARSKTLYTYGNTSHENREILGLPAADRLTGRVGKSKDARRR
jgi:hypothetical protein